MKCKLESYLNIDNLSAVHNNRFDTYIAKPLQTFYRETFFTEFFRISLLSNTKSIYYQCNTNTYIAKSL